MARARLAIEGSPDHRRRCGDLDTDAQCTSSPPVVSNTIPKRLDQARRNSFLASLWRSTAAVVSDPPASMRGVASHDSPGGRQWPVRRATMSYG
jgi:hypothetical protein